MLPDRALAALKAVVSDIGRIDNLPPLAQGMLPYISWLRFIGQKKNAEPMLWIVPDDLTALEFMHAWNSLAHGGAEVGRAKDGVRPTTHGAPEAPRGALVSWGVIPYSFTIADKEKEYQRTRAEYLIRSKTPCLIVASVEGITQRISTSNGTSSEGLALKPGLKIERTALADFLSRAGFSHASPVERPGEFCIKGGIVDIFPPDEDFAVRLDFFGDAIESIKAFSHETQRSYKALTEVRVSPLKPDTAGLVHAIEKLAQTIVPQKLELPPILATLAANPAGYADVYPALTPTAELSELWTGQVYCYDTDAVTNRLEALAQERSYLYEKSQGKYRLTVQELFADDLKTEKFIAGALDIPLQTETKEPQGWRNAPKFGGRIGLLKEKLSDEPEKNFCFFIESEGQQERLRLALTDLHEPLILPQYYPHGFENESIAVYTESDVFGRVVKKYAADKKISKILESYTDLKEGDFVVHVNYGIGRFQKLVRMKIQDKERDFLELAFAEGDKLFVPLDQLNLVHKYIGSTENPHLDYLGKKSSWARTRARVKRLVDSIAEELVELYALRQEQKGYAFGPDSTFQHDFEAAFPFTETEHQLEAIQAIKHDMESERPMDRLVCGDVGFGKTEVAIRAAFKAAMAGKQVAILCPTTILAFQHHRSFSKRFADYPVRIDFISRFRTASEITEIKERLAQGKIDIIIGTHALLAGDIKYKSLGLLIVDEEQRFGVTHKEKLRQMKHNIDCLALTATPIPRTLHMSLSGIRDLSIIETPPADRRKIETHVLAENEELLRIAVKRELERGGQIYVLHNKVSTIEEQAARIRQLAPTARIAVLHGQMPEGTIEEVMIDFYQHAYDILVSTTIIESGIDIPNANTLIVLGAHMFGLSQLYQLKGRVGRSDRQAYAYFFHPGTYGGVAGRASADAGSVPPLSGDAERRLEVLSEYDDLGSGFRIAMKDLEIRGAGNLLGKEQSGEIMEIGFELYSQMLNDKIAELKGQNRIVELTKCVIMLPADWYFPDDYIADTREKMEFYKAFSAAEDLDEYKLAHEALLDRFGKPPEVVENMLILEEIRHLANALGFERIALTDSLYFIVSANHQLDMAKVAALLSRDKRFSLDPADAKRINLNIPVTQTAPLLRELKAILKFLTTHASLAAA